MKKNLSKSVLSIYFIALSFFAHSQTGGVSVNNSNAPAHPSAMLDISSTSAPYMGMLIPRMTTASRNSISSPATGLQVFNTDCGMNEYYTGTCWISMGQNLKAPDPITCSGTTDFCANETRTFTIPTITGATAYQWTVPAGATIVSGQSSNSVTVVFGNHSGDVCVRSANLCESSAYTCISVYINPVPPTPGNITGPTTVLPGTSASYFIASVTGAGVYNWTVPSGATITSGVGTTTITVNFSCSAVSGNITVAAQSNCGTSSANALAITLTPVSANAGPGVVSPGRTLGGSPTAIGGATPYVYAWLPSSSLSSTTVANPTTSVCSNTTYTVTVTDANGCTASSSATATAIIPSIPGSISGITSVPCSANSGIIYSINSVQYATTYTWTVPSGASIASGQGTTLITLNLGASSGGNITVTAGNSCGTSSASTIAVTVIGGGGSGSQTFNATSTGKSGTIQSFTIPSCVTSLTIEAWGAAGANGGSSGYGGGGRGAYIKGTVSVTPGQILKILVGQMGKGGTAAGGGGGGTFVATSANSPLIVAGGGGANRNSGTNNSVEDASVSQNGVNGDDGTGGTGGNGGSNCSYDCHGAGGAGFTGDGTTGDSRSMSVKTAPSSFVNGGIGGELWYNMSDGESYHVIGGFGGGAAGGWGGAGGGGGYSGGGGGNNGSPGYAGGGGSYNSGTNQTNTAGASTGDGQVILTW